MLVPPDWAANKIIMAYYRELNADPDFLLDLRQSFENPDGFKAVAEKWRLPRQSVEDWEYSRQLYKQFPDVPLIRDPKFFLVVPPVGVPVEVKKFGDFELIYTSPLVTPAVPSFEYTSFTSSGQIDAICAEIRRNILLQIAEYERQAKEAGWRDKPPRYSQDYFARLGRCLYSRAIKQMTWDEIADTVNLSPPEKVVDADSIRKTTTAAAQLAGIAL